MHSFITFLRSVASSPGKTLLTLLTVGVGVGVLILALSISIYFESSMNEQLEKDGMIVMVGNVEIATDGTYEQVRPSEFDENVQSLLLNELPGIQAVTTLMFGTWNQVRVDNTNYQLRNVAGVTDGYDDVMNLEIILGEALTTEDINSGAKKVLLSESLAVILFGSVDAALDQNVQPPATMANMPGRNRNQTATIQNFTVSGIYTDPGEIKRKAYEIADAIVPFSAFMPGGMNFTQIMSRMNGILALRVMDTDLESVEARVRDILTRAYGDDISLEIWEGTAQGPSVWLQDTRETIATFSLVVNLLGFVLLVTGSIGILSIMLVEVLGKTKQMGIERALGASKGMIIKEFFVRSMLYSLCGGVIGLILSLVFSSPLQDLLAPVFAGTGLVLAESSMINIIAIAVGFGAAMIAGGIFGILPVFSALQSGISDSIREA